MKAKAAVTITGASFEIGYAAGVAEGIYRRLFGRSLVVTSVKDSTHGSGSLHYAGKAADLRTRDLRPEDQQRLFQALKDALNPQGFDVVLESDHLHVEFDPKAGEKFLEVVA